MTGVSHTTCRTELQRRAALASSAARTPFFQASAAGPLLAPRRYMPRSLRIGTIAGIALEIHVTWLFALGLAVVSLSGQVGGPLTALVTALAFFAGLIAHE